MDSYYYISTPTDAVTAPAGGTADVVYTVSQGPDGPRAARAVVQPQGEAKAEWAKVLNGAEWEFDAAPAAADSGTATAGGAATATATATEARPTRQVTVRFAVPKDAAVGRYTYQLDVVDPANTDAHLTVGPTVAVEVTTPALVVKKKFPWWVVAVAAGVVVVGVAVALLWPRKATVPDLAGQTVDGARAALAGRGLDVGAVASAFQDGKPVGTVVGQSPAAGAAVKKGAKVDVTVSAEGVAVPNVVGERTQTAATLLQLSKLAAAEKERQFTGKAEPGTVLSQDPPKGAMVAAGSSVALVVEGESVVVPALVDEAEAAAEQKLQKLGLKKERVDVVAAERPVGRVANQTPAAGTRVPPGSVVRLGVEAGVKVPPVTGATALDARRRLTAEGLAVTAGPPKQVYRPGEPEGRVVDQSPQVGRVVKSGSPVTLSVSWSGPAVPNVVGKPQAAAVKALEDAGLVADVKVIDLPNNQPSNVFRQEPLPGVRVPPRSKVTVTIFK